MPLRRVSFAASDDSLAQVREYEPTYSPSDWVTAEQVRTAAEDAAEDAAAEQAEIKWCGRMAHQRRGFLCWYRLLAIDDDDFLWFTDSAGVPSRPDIATGHGRSFYEHAEGCIVSRCDPMIPIGYERWDPSICRKRWYDVGRYAWECIPC